MKLLRSGFVTLWDALEPKWQRGLKSGDAVLFLSQRWIFTSFGMYWEVLESFFLNRTLKWEMQSWQRDGVSPGSISNRRRKIVMMDHVTTAKTRDRLIHGSFVDLPEICWGWLDGWGLESSGSIFIHVSGNWCWLSPGVFSWIANWNIHKWPLHWPELPHSMVTSGYSLISVAGQCSKSVSANKVETALSYDLASEVTQHSFCYFLFIIETQACLDPKEGSVDCTSWWMKCQGHMAEEHVGWEIWLQLKCNQQQALSSQKIFALFIFI